MPAATIHTVGHSTRTLEELAEMLAGHGVEVVADVRRFPSSRRLPHFNAPVLAEGLAERGIGYAPFRDLGGRRRALPPDQSANNGWRVEGFRGYADYMQTPEFAEASRRLEDLARKRATAFLCAEALPWRCHRSLIADALVARGWTVLHIMGAGPSAAQPHALRDFARVEGGTVVYPPPQVEPGGQQRLAFGQKPPQG